MHCDMLKIHDGVGVVEKLNFLRLHSGFLSFNLLVSAKGFTYPHLMVEIQSNSGNTPNKYRATLHETDATGLRIFVHVYLHFSKLIRR